MNYWRLIERLTRLLFAPIFWLSKAADGALWWVMEQGASWDYAHGNYVDAFAFWDNDEDAVYDEY